MEWWCGPRYRRIRRKRSLFWRAASQAENDVVAFAVLDVDKHASFPRMKTTSVSLSERIIPNEKSISGCWTTCSTAALVITTIQRTIHVLRARSQKQKTFARNSEPKYFIPVHGEYRLVPTRGVWRSVGSVRQEISAGGRQGRLEFTERTGRADWNRWTQAALLGIAGSLEEIEEVVIPRPQASSEDGMRGADYAIDKHPERWRSHRRS